MRGSRSLRLTGTGEMDGEGKPTIGDHREPPYRRYGTAEPVDVGEAERDGRVPKTPAFRQVKASLTFDQNPFSCGLLASSGGASSSSCSSRNTRSWSFESLRGVQTRIRTS